MSDQIAGEVRIFAGETPPEGWAICDGRLLTIEEYPELFSVVGTAYGGNGRETFAIPNLSGRVVLHAGYRPGLMTRQLGEYGGRAAVQLDEGHLPMHEHALAVPMRRGLSGTSGESALADAVPSASAFGNHQGNQLMSEASVGQTGSSKPHNNMQPYLALNYIIALTGIVPEPD